MLTEAVEASAGGTSSSALWPLTTTPSTDGPRRRQKQEQRPRAFAVSPGGTCSVKPKLVAHMHTPADLGESPGPDASDMLLLQQFYWTRTASGTWDLGPGIWGKGSGVMGMSKGTFCFTPHLYRNLRMMLRLQNCDLFLMPSAFRTLCHFSARRGCSLREVYLLCPRCTR